MKLDVWRRDVAPAERAYCSSSESIELVWVIPKGQFDADHLHVRLSLSGRLVVTGKPSECRRGEPIQELLRLIVKIVKLAANGNDMTRQVRVDFRFSIEPTRLDDCSGFLVPVTHAPL